MLLQGWQTASYATGWCTGKGLSIRGMRFAKDVRGQLQSMMARDDFRQDNTAAAADGRSPADERRNLQLDAHKERKRKREHAGGAYAVA